ncbi:hypothetical protein AKJ16_DCAP24894 [Drosera capensis]
MLLCLHISQVPQRHLPAYDHNDKCDLASNAQASEQKRISLSDCIFLIICGNVATIWMHSCYLFPAPLSLSCCLRLSSDVFAIIGQQDPINGFLSRPKKSRSWTRKENTAVKSHHFEHLSHVIFSWRN